MSEDNKRLARPQVSRASHLPWDEVQRVLLYCAQVREKLGLSHWDVGIAVDTADDEAHANVESVAGKLMASLMLAENWMEKPDHLKQTVLVHEMCHLLHQQQEHSTFALLDGKDEISTNYKEYIHDTYHLQTEYMVDGLAVALSRLPGFLPPWPTKAAAAKANLQNLEP